MRALVQVFWWIVLVVLPLGLWVAAVVYMLRAGAGMASCLLAPVLFLYLVALLLVYETQRGRAARRVSEAGECRSEAE